MCASACSVGSTARRLQVFIVLLHVVTEATFAELTWADAFVFGLRNRGLTGRSLREKKNKKKQKQDARL